MKASVPCSKVTNLASNIGISYSNPKIWKGCVHIVPSNSVPLKVFKILNFSIPQDFTLDKIHWLQQQFFFL